MDYLEIAKAAIKEADDNGSTMDARIATAAALIALVERLDNLTHQTKTDVNYLRTVPHKFD